jgi:transcription initiation factor TFIID subunit 7
MQGYDRELDSEDDETGEGMAFEEQLILRVPDGPGEHGELDALRQAIRRRGEYDDVWFKFKDARRAVFHIGQQLYAAKLVDLPCIVESHKTLDNKQMFKIADISQMLLIERPIADEAEATAQSSHKSSNDDYIYPHGITPPMTWVRKRGICVQCIKTKQWCAKSQCYALAHRTARLAAELRGATIRREGQEIRSGCTFVR